ncbi:hypothetical protein ACFSQ7_46440 [Paenibacillus rhizoplanae]
MLTPNISREYDGIDFKVDKIEFTPVTTNLTTQIKKFQRIRKISELYKSNRSIGYDMFDEKREKNTKRSLVMDGVPQVVIFRYQILGLYHLNLLLKSIIIKPYIYLYKENKKRMNSYWMKNGNIKVKYIPELQITLPITTK